MKNIRTKVIAIIVAGATFIPAIPVNAASLGDGLVKEQQRLLNLQTKQQILQLRTTIKNNEKTNSDLVISNKELKKSIKEIIQQIKQSKKVIPANDLSNIEAQIKTVRQDTAALLATKSSMQADRSAAKNDIQSKNWEDLITQLNNIISVQEKRTADLQQINKDLNTLLNTLKTAQADLTTASTS